MLLLLINRGLDNESFYVLDHPANDRERGKTDTYSVIPTKFYGVTTEPQTRIRTIELQIATADAWLPESIVVVGTVHDTTREPPGPIPAAPIVYVNIPAWPSGHWLSTDQSDAPVGGVAQARFMIYQEG
jgi:hypothetical protein